MRPDGDAERMPNASQPTFTAPEGLSNTILTFEVEVSDGTTTSTDTVTITVNADNDAPSAEAGPDQTVDEGDAVTLDGSGSTDPEGQGLTYTWTQVGGTSVTLSEANASQPTFTAPEGLSNTTLTFEVEVSDGTTTSTDTVTITVNADNDAPSAEAGPNQTVDEGDEVTLDGSGSTDPEGQGLTYTWTQVGGTSVTLSEANASQPTFTAPEGLSNTTLTFEVEVSDGTNTSTDTVTITVNADNDAPSAEAGPSQTVDEGDAVTLDGSSSSDPEGQGLTYSWTQVGGTSVTLSDANVSQPTFTAPEGLSNTTLTFEVEVSDGTNTSTDTVTITVNADNDAPTAHAGSPQMVESGNTLRLDGSASSDPDNRELTYSWRQLGGPAITLGDPSSAHPEIQVPASMESAELVFELTVSDGETSSTDTVMIRIHNPGSADAERAPDSGATDGVVDPGPAMQDDSSQDAGGASDAGSEAGSGDVDASTTVPVEPASNPSVEDVPPILASTPSVSADGDEPSELGTNGGEVDRAEREAVPAADGPDAEPDRSGAAAPVGVVVPAEGDPESDPLLRDAGSSEEASDDGAWRRWQTFDDDEQGRDVDGDSAGDRTSGRFGRMWLSLMASIRSLFASDPESKSR